MLEIVLYTIVLLITGIVFLVSLLIGAGVIAILFVKVPFAPTPQKNVEKIIEQFELKPGQIFYDLGCGDGRFIIAAQNKGAKATGFEVSPWAYTKAKFNLWYNKSQAKINFKNFYFQDISDADAVFCFLINKVMAQVESKLKQELKPGAKIVCYGFNLPTWPLKKVTSPKPNEKRASKIYLYQKD